MHRATGSRPRHARRFAVGAVAVANVAVLWTTGAARSATVSDPALCLAERSGSQVTLSWLDDGGRHVIRRDGSYLADAGRDVSSWTDANAPAGSTYELRTWKDGVRTDRPCIEDGAPPPDDADCWVERSGSSATVRWIDEGGSHVVRRNGSWLATVGSQVSSYVDGSSPSGSTYEVRTWRDGQRSDRPCGSGTGDPDPPPNPTTPPPSSGDVELVIHVSIDGLRGDYVTPSLMPNLTQLRNQGASTLNARTDPAFTQTLPNHHSMFTGRSVYGGNGHGVDYNNDLGRTVHKEAGEYVASVFDVVHDRGGSTSLYAGKSKFDMVDRNWSKAGRADSVGVDNGKDKIDEYRQTSPTAAIDRLRTALHQRPKLEFVFFHIRNPDNAGHQHNWGSSEYRAAVKESDRILGQVLAVIGNSSKSDSTAIIVVADHGGPLWKDLHSDASKVGNYTVPFVVWGPGVKSGADLYALNRGVRTDPGTARIWLGGDQPIRSHEVANLALDLLGYPAVPDSNFNRSQDLAVN